MRIRSDIAEYVIRSLEEPADADYWSNEYGWVPYDQADRFTEMEKRILHLPIGGVWVLDHVVGMWDAIKIALTIVFVFALLFWVAWLWL